MKKSIFFLAFFVCLLSENVYELFSQEEARTTIILTDKEGNPKPNLDFDLLNYSDNSIKAKGRTDEAGKYIIMLSKGGSYIVFFKQEGKEWNFNFEVPNKPGRKAYTYKFAIYLEETREVGYRSTSDFDVKKDPTICSITIIIRDQSGMALPFQPFTIFTKDNAYRQEVISDSSGEYKTELKRDKRYELLSELDGFKFTTYIDIGKDIEFLKYVFDIDFNLITHSNLDTTYVEKEIAEKRDIHTIIRVVNKQGQVEEDAEVVLEESNKRVFNGITDKTGEVNTMTDRTRVYDVYVRKMNKTFVYEMILPDDETITEFLFIAEVDFKKQPKRKFRLNAYFDTGKWDLRSESFPDLERLLKMMQDNTKMIIEVEGHTDSRGASKPNQVLSENRAKSVLDWLVERGIEGKRVTHIGYGENMPCATNKTEPGRQLNRRIEVSVMDE
ncbi:MAG: OmpA family protein [bacterium]